MPLATRVGILFALSLEAPEPAQQYAYARQALQLAIELQDTARILNAITGIVYQLNVEGKLDSAISLAKQGLQFAHGLAHKRSEMELLAEMASLYYTLENFEKAIEYGRKSLLISNAIGASDSKPLILNNLGEFYFQLNQWDSARAYYTQAIQAAQNQQEPQLMAYATGGLGMVYAQTNKKDSALLYMEQSVTALEGIEDWYGMGYFLQELAHLALKGKDYTRAARYLHQTLAMATAHGLKTLQKDTHQSLSGLYKSMNRADSAVYHYQQYIAQRDSLNNENNRRALAEARASYEIGLAQAETEKVAAQNNTLKARVLAAVLGLIALGVLLVWGFLYVRYRRRKEVRRYTRQVDQLLLQQEKQVLEAIITGQEQERKRLAQELHDHFGSLLATVKLHISTLKPGQAQKQSLIKNMVAQALNDIRSLSHSLNVGMADQFGLSSALEALAGTINQSGVLAAKLHISLEPETLDTRQEITLYRVVQELVSNVLKHAQASQLSITITGFDDLVNVMIEDNGKGFAPETTGARSQGMGLKGLKERIAAIEGQFSIDSRPGQGTIVNMDIPVNNQAQTQAIP